MVLGADAGTEAGLPASDDLVQNLREDLRGRKIEVEPPFTDLPSVAERYEQEFGKEKLRKRIAELLRHDGEPSDIHRTVARLNTPMIFTCNWDTLMEQALDKAQRRYAVVREDRDLKYVPKDTDITLVKMCGDITAPGDIVITESDLLDYPESHGAILNEFRQRLRSYTFLFVGRSVEDRTDLGIMERELIELRKHKVRHFIIQTNATQGWIDYYGRLCLKTVALDSADDVVPFLEELARRAGTVRVDQFLEDRELTRVSGQLSGDTQLAADDQITAELNEVLQLYAKGHRESIRDKALLIWERLKDRDGESVTPLKVKTLLLLALLSLQVSRKPDVSSAAQYLEEADKVADQSNQDDLALVRAIWEHANGNTSAALAALVRMSGQPAVKWRFAVLLDTEDLDGCTELIGTQNRNPGEDRDWDWMLARYYSHRGDFDRAAEIVKKWTDAEDVDPPILEMEAHIEAGRARHKYEAFCKRRHLFENFSIFLAYEQLIDCHEAGKAAKKFQKVAKAFFEMGERSSAQVCVRNSFTIGQICGDVLEELEDAEKVFSDESLRPVRALFASTGPGSLSIQQFDEAFAEGNCLPYVATKLRDWAIETGRLGEAARLLETESVRLRFDSLEDRAAWTTIIVEILMNAGKVERALQIIEDFLPPADYAYFPEILKIGYYLHRGDNNPAATLLDELRKIYPENPIVLTLLCERYEREDDWKSMLKEAEKLLNDIAIAQTYEYYLTAVGNLQKWAQLLDVIDKAQSAGIELSPTWTYINRARALFALDRYGEAQKVLEEARELQSKGQLQMLPQDHYNLTACYVANRENERALQEAEALVKEHPEFPQGFLGLNQLLMEVGDHKEAFEYAGKAAERFPDNEEIQSMYIQTALMTGHGDMVQEDLKSFHERFPDSQLLRLVPQEQAFQMMKKHIERAERADDMYRMGRIPGIIAAYRQSTMPSFFRFWHARTLTRRGIYVANGDQSDDWKLLAEHVKAGQAAVMDFGALLTAYELQEADGKWHSLLRKTFRKIYLPESFRQILAFESSSILGQIQSGRYRSLKELRNRIDLNQQKFPPPIPTGEGMEDALGDETERSYAQEHRLYYLNEYGEEEERLSTEFGFQELAVLFSAHRNLTPAQQRKLERLARKRDFRPLPQSREALREIVANVTTLGTLAETELLEPVLSYFRTVHVSELGRQQLIAEIASAEFTEQLAD